MKIEFYKMLKLVLMAIFIHIILIVAVVDIYYVSPIEKGMIAYKVERPVPAKRLVIMLADGLRAEQIYGQHGNRTPFLTKVRKHHATWGISHTRVPTESRPGTVALMAGLYEDPSAILKGWKANPVEFDTVFNQSAYSYCWGSPDTLAMFKNSRNTTFFPYEKALYDFDDRYTYLLDMWVFNLVTAFIKNKTVSAATCKEVCSAGNIFFLHLVGTDMAGHTYLPNSEELITNIKKVDEGVELVEKLFSQAFKDNSTAYIFTADHGMTDWGAHGDGSDMETETPFIAWGPGFKISNNRIDLNQADITPLMSTIVGINIPINSIGIIPHNVLNLQSDVLASAMIANVKQLVAQYDTKSAKLKKKTIPLLYQPYKYDGDFNSYISDLDNKFQNGKYYSVIDESIIVLNKARFGLRYVQVYHRMPLLICVGLGILLWLLYLITIIMHSINVEQNLSSNEILISSKIKYSINIIIGALFTITNMFIYIHEVSTTVFFYTLFPFLMLYLLIPEIGTVGHMINFKNYDKIFLQYCILYFVGIELWILTFYNRCVLFLLMLSIGAWLYNKHIDKNKKFIWFFSSAALGCFTFFPTIPSTFYSSLFLLVVVLWIYLYYYEFRKLYKHIQLNGKDKTIYKKITAVQFVTFIAAALNTFIIFTFPETNYLNVLSWFLLIVLIILMPLSPTNLVLRISHIFSIFMGVYIMFSIYLEGLFAILLIVVLSQWISHEFQLKVGPENSIYNVDFALKPTELLIYNGASEFQISFFAMSLILASFFGTGNIASVNSFNPIWVKSFLSEYKPFEMCALIILKLTIPFLLIICSFRAICLLTNKNISRIFCIVLFYCDIMVLHFIFFITDEGSWLQVGTALSNFIIAEATTFVFIIYYFVAYWLTTNTWYNKFIKLLTLYFK